MRILAATALAVLALAGCGYGSSRPDKPSGAATTAASGGYLGNVGTPGCVPLSSLHGTIPETGLDTPKGSVWALFFTPVPPPAGTEIKVVWRMTGSGRYTFRVTDQSSLDSPLAWGPEEHGGSSWNKHPGDEVGTGFNFAHAGCWNIHIARSDTSADLWLPVS